MGTIKFFGVLLGGAIIVIFITDFTLELFGLWFAIPILSIIVGFICWIVYQSYEPKEVEG